MAVEEAGAHTPLLRFGTAYVRRLTSAGPDTQTTRYLAQVARVVDWITAATGSELMVESFTSDCRRPGRDQRATAGGREPEDDRELPRAVGGDLQGRRAQGARRKNPCEGVRLPSLDSSTEDEGDKTFLTESEFALLRASMHADSRDLLTVAVGARGCGAPPCREGEEPG